MPASTASVEAYGSPGVGVKEGILALKPELIGKDPLGIDALMTGLGWRTDGSAHMLIRAASGIEMALWDLAGKTLGVPTTTLLGGKFRDRVRMYDHSAPRDMMDPIFLSRVGRTREVRPEWLQDSQVRI